ncbi:MAG: hypothetical protein ABEJ28_07255 [Salinigranum sp.]
MPLNEAQWDGAEEREDVLSLVYGALEGKKPAAYSIEELFEEAESGAESTAESSWGVMGALVGGETAEHRYEWVFETLVHEGKLEKRTVRDGGEAVSYYRAV